MSYLGVYSNTAAGTSVGTTLAPDKDKKSLLTVEKFSTQDRHTFSKEALKDAELNVAKIRVVSTLPGKSVDSKIKDKAYVGFILTEVQETHNEKVELVPLPGDTYASYFYGASPRQFNFNGVLLNTDQDQWRDSFEQLYEEHLRGSKSSRNFNIVQIRYGGRIVSGWLLSMSQQQSSQSDLYSQFSFSVLVSRIDMLNQRRDKYTDYLISAGEDFSAADGLSRDYAILDQDNYNAMIDPLRTGTVVPPKRPKRGGRRRGNNGCYFTNPKGDGGESNLNGSVTISDHINDSARCTVFDAIQNQRNKIANIAKEIEDKTAKGTITREELKRLSNEKERLVLQLRKKLNDPVVGAAMQKQAEAAMVRTYNESLKDSKTKRATSIHDLPNNGDTILQENQKFASGKRDDIVINVGGKEVVVGKVGTVGWETTKDGERKRRAVVTSTFTQVSDGRASQIQSGKGGTVSAEERKNESVRAAIAINNAEKALDEKDAQRARDSEQAEAANAAKLAAKTKIRSSSK